MMTELLGNEADRKSAAIFLAVMGNSKRLLILGLLVHGELSVGKLAELAGMSQSALSQHLAKMRALRLVSTRRDAQTIYYSCASPSVITVLGVLDNLFASGVAGGLEAPASIGLRQ